MTTRGFMAELSHNARTLRGDALRQALQSARSFTRAHVESLSETALTPPLVATINPPLWECAHVAWFAEWWCVRGGHNTAIGETVADRPSLWADADAMLNSNLIAHDARWDLPLLTRTATLAYMDATQESLLAALARTPDDNDALYPFRLALFHEAMHLEALAWCAQTLAWPRPAWVRPLNDMHRPGEVVVPATSFHAGYRGEGFSFDNERDSHELAVEAFAIDQTPISNAQFLQFVESGEYQARVGAPHPRYWRNGGDQWQLRHFDAWQPLDPRAPVIHISAVEADAYCHWAGRRLPDEFEWEAAATLGLIDWGDSVWEWTAGAFMPYPGFSADRYREYSAPWFDGRHRALRGGSHATLEIMHHARYRNFFMPQRNDVFAGFRTCALR